jgi:KDO2-lipid IV(A) lauroyltransferase
MHILIGACSLSPITLLRRVGLGVGWVAWRGFRVRRRVVLENISRSFPEADARTVDSIALESYEQYGMALMEFAALRSLSSRRLMEMIDVEGLENFDVALSHGRGAVLFSGHFGNWELLGALIARCGYPLNVTDTNHSNKLVHGIISDLRTRQGMKIIAPAEPLSRITSLLAQNKFVSYLADQDARRDGIFVEFLGRPASTVRGPAVLSIRRRCPIVAGFLIRQGVDRHLAVFEKPIWPDGRLKGADAVRELTQRFTRLLEGYVRKYPGQYFWMHRRWKTKPEPVRPR